MSQTYTNKKNTPTRRIAILDHTAALGGAEIALLRLVQAVDHTRYTPIVILFADGPLVQRLRDAGIETHIVELDPQIAKAERHSLGKTDEKDGDSRIKKIWDLLTYCKKLMNTLKDLHIDILHTHSLKADIIGLIANLWLKKPLIWHIHDRISPDYLPRPVVMVLRLLARYVPTHVIVNSQATLETLLPLDHGRYTIAYPGLPPEMFYRPKEFTSRSNEPIIGLVGRISPTKGQDIFLQAAAEVLKTHRHIKFRIIGAALFNEKVFEETVRALPDKLGIADSVEFTGFVNNPQEQIRALDLLVHASPVPEPFGQVVIEAMAAEVPVIATQAGGIPEIIRPDPTKSATYGLLTQPGNVAELSRTICWALDHPPEISVMVRLAYHHARDHFSITQTAYRVIQAWERIRTG